MFNFIKWILAAFASLGAMARGAMPTESQEIQQIKQEMEELNKMTDREKLHLDKQNYAQDHRRAFEKMSAAYG